MTGVAGADEPRHFIVGAATFTFPAGIVAGYERGPPGRTSLTLHAELDGELAIRPRNPRTPAAARLIIGLNDIARDLSRALGPYAPADRDDARDAAGLTLHRTHGNFRYFVADPMLRPAPDGQPIAYGCQRVRVGSREGAFCRTWYRLTNKLSVEYMFDEAHLPRWNDLDRAVRQFVETARIMSR